MIFVLKVITNKEDSVMELLAERAEKKQLQIFSIARPHGLRGYILVEALDRETLEEVAFRIQNVKGIIQKTVSYEEIKNLLEPVTAAIKIEKNDIVEIIAGPFKKEKARVLRVDKGKEEVIIEPLGAAVPIPITDKIDNVRVIRREAEEREKREEDELEEE